MLVCFEVFLLDIRRIVVDARGAVLSVPAKIGENDGREQCGEHDHLEYDDPPNPFRFSFRNALLLGLALLTVSRSGQALQLFLRVMMPVFAVRHIMVMFMRVCHRVRMGTAVMGMSKAVLMNMGVIPDQRIRYHQRRPGDHDDKRRKVGPRQHFLKQDER